MKSPCRNEGHRHPLLEFLYNYNHLIHLTCASIFQGYWHVLYPLRSFVFSSQSMLSLPLPALGRVRAHHTGGVWVWLHPHRLLWRELHHPWVHSSHIRLLLYCTFQEFETVFFMRREGPNRFQKYHWNRKLFNTAPGCKIPYLDANIWENQPFKVISPRGAYNLHRSASH